jgi:hypothetical protein
LSEVSGSAAFVLALSLLMSSPAEWMAARRSMLALAVRHGVAHWLGTSGPADAAAAASRRSSKSGGLAVSGLSDAQLCKAAAPMVRMAGIVDWLQQWAKPAVSSSSSSSSSGWSGGMADRLRGLAGCAEAAGDLVELVDEGSGCLGLQDCVDGVGLLGVVLGAGGVASCEDFVRKACAPL